MKIVLLGPQGSGKGTQAERLSELTGARHISTGVLVRAEIAAGTPLGRTVQRYHDEGELVPDEVIVRMVEPLLAGPSWILDGFPRTLTQAEMLDQALTQLGTSLDRVILLDAPDDLLVARLTQRVQSQSTGRVYNLITKPPPPDDPGPFVRRSDDTLEDILRRLELYHQETEPLKAYYAARGVLTPVNAAPPVDAVTAEILSVLLPA